MSARNFIDLVGRRFGRLVVLSYAGQKKAKSYWNCRCDCGKKRTIYGGSLTRGLSSSCGCLQAERRSESHTTHGAWKGGKETGAHMSWRMMMSRCYSPRNNRYSEYGGRGIRVCDRWQEFPNFLADMGERPEGLTIERRDTNQNYSKRNCRWASQRVQQNNRRNNRRITAFGKTLTMADWARLSGVRHGTIFARLKAGWSAERAVSA